MRTDVFPEEDSVRVVWVMSCNCEDCIAEGSSHRWKVQSRSKRARQLRFAANACGPVDDSDEDCTTHPQPENNCQVDFIGRIGIEALRAYGHAGLSRAYFDGLMGRRGVDLDGDQRDAYYLGVDEAQLIDWQK